VRIVPTADIRLDRLKHNLNEIRTLVGPSKIFAVVKANAYGHGLVPIARALEKYGTDGFCVAVISEIEQLLNSGITKPILHLGRLHKETLEINHPGNLWLTVNTFDDIPLISRAAIKQDQSVIVHLKIDTGMGRLGIPVSDAMKLADEIVNIPNVKLEGIWSHLSTSEEENRDYFSRQLDLFKNVAEQIKLNIPEIKYLHLANSAAILKYPESHFDMVRPGIALYGSSITKDVTHSLRPVMSMNAPVTMVKQLKSGDSVGYNRTYILKRDTTIAVVQAGYADGIPIELSNCGEVWAKDQSYKIIGKISMDQTAVDVTHSPLKPGEMVTFWGGSASESKVETIAAKAGKIPYELLVSVSGRAERIYREDVK